MAGKGGKTRTSFVKGQGRKKGAENKATKDIKEAVKLLVEANIPNMTIWLEKIAVKSPMQAMMVINGLLEYTIPKLARQDNVSSDGSMSPKPTIEVTSEKAKNELNKLVNES